MALLFGCEFLMAPKTINEKDRRQRWTQLKRTILKRWPRPRPRWLWKWRIQAALAASLEVRDRDRVGDGGNSWWMADVMDGTGGTDSVGVAGALATPHGQSKPDSTPPDTDRLIVSAWAAYVGVASGGRSHVAWRGGK